MTLSVTLEFSDAELDYFRTCMRRARERNGHRSPDEIAAAAADAVRRLQSIPRSPFVARRIDRVERLVAMLQHELEGYEEFDTYRRDEALQRDKPGRHRPVSRDQVLISTTPSADCNRTGLPPSSIARPAGHTGWPGGSAGA